VKPSGGVSRRRTMSTGAGPISARPLCSRVALCCFSPFWPGEVARGGGKVVLVPGDLVAGGGLLRFQRPSAMLIDLHSGASSCFCGGSWLSSWIWRAPSRISAAAPVVAPFLLHSTRLAVVARRWRRAVRLPLLGGRACIQLSSSLRTPSSPP
jgi:hypothetical protein